MRLHWSFQILTLVLCLAPNLAESSPKLPTPPSAISQKKADQSTEGSESPAKPYELESLSMEPLKEEAPGDVRGKMVASRTVRKHSRSALASFWNGALLDKTSQSAFGATLLFQNENRNESAQSYGLSILSNRAFGLHWDFQKHCCLGDYSEPNWGFGIGSLWSTEDSLASLANFERYHLRARIGFEDLFKLDRRLRTEFILKVSPLGFSFQIGAGWTWDESEFLF